MDEQGALRNIRLYTWYAAILEPLFWGPILVMAFMRLGSMTLEEIYVMEGVVIAGLVVLEIPSGALADRLGRKRVLVLGSALYCLSVVWFACMRTSIDVWIANLFWMVAVSLRSGADEAFLYDSLKEAGQEEKYVRVEGRAFSNRLLLFGISSLFSGFLAEIHIRLPMMLSIPGMLAAVWITTLFIDPIRTKPLCSSGYVQTIKESMRIVRGNSSVMWMIGFTTLLAIGSKLWFITYNPYFELVGLELRWYGVDPDPLSCTKRSR